MLTAWHSCRESRTQATILPFSRQLQKALGKSPHTFSRPGQPSSAPARSRLHGSKTSPIILYASCLPVETYLENALASVLLEARSAADVERLAAERLVALRYLRQLAGDDPIFPDLHFANCPARSGCYKSTWTKIGHGHGKRQRSPPCYSRRSTINAFASFITASTCAISQLRRTRGKGRDEEPRVDRHAKEAGDDSTIGKRE
jgi:hypothetical protein